jgi:lactoylglutathione lyase
MKHIIISFVLSLLFTQFQPAFAQSAAPQNQLPTTLNHIAVNVVNLEKSTAFYKEVLNLHMIPEPFHDGLHTWFSIGGNAQLHLIQRATETIEHDKNTHLCFSVKSMDDFSATLDKFNIDRINWVGDSKEPTLRVDGVKQIYFQDPDGYWIEVNDDFPEE